MVGRPRKNPVENMVGKIVFYDAGSFNGEKPGKNKIPMIVTHCNADGTIDGVLFTARPLDIVVDGVIDARSNVPKGSGAKTWSPISGE